MVALPYSFEVNGTDGKKIGSGRNVLVRGTGLFKQLFKRIQHHIKVPLTIQKFQFFLRSACKSFPNLQYMDMIKVENPAKQRLQNRDCKTETAKHSFVFSG